MNKFNQFCVVLVTLALSVAVNGFVVSTMWNWFIVPLGAPSIGFWLAAGISLLISLFTTSQSDENDIEFSKAIAHGWATLVARFLVLGFGAIIHSFI